MRRTSTILVTAALGLASLALVRAPSQLPVADVGDGAMHEVVFDGAVVQADRDALAGVGATAVTFAPPTGYRAWLSSAAASELEGRADVLDVRRLAADEVLSDALDTGDPASTPVAVRVAAPALETVQAAVAARGTVLGVTEVREVAGLVDLVAVVPGPAATVLAGLPGVAHVGPAPGVLELEDEATAAVLAGLFAEPVPTSSAPFGPVPQVVPGYEEFLTEVGVDGSGVVVAVVDDGVDEEHPQLDVVATRDYVTPHDEPTSTTGHGTHVAGIVGATGSGIPDPLALDSAGFEPGVGVAPGAGLANQNLIATTGLFTTDVIGLFEQVVHDAIGFGANIWNASWTSGEGTGVGYLASGARLDALVRDGSPDAGVQPFTMVFSAGNSGPGATTLTSPKEAKNLIVVGATNAPAPAGPTLLASGGDPRAVTSFSSRGPTVDGRLGVTVVAPGGDVRSTASLTRGGLCFEQVLDPPSQLYTFCSGTSMASPHVAGAAALVTEWWRQQVGDVEAVPTAALVKGLLVNSARPAGIEPIPNTDVGWGMVDLDALLRPQGPRVVRDGLDLLTDPGEAQEFEVVSDGSSPLRVTLSWLDVPGDPAAATALVNDLDLEVVAPDGTTYLGNVFEDGGSVPGGAPDRLEVLENVFLDAPQAGTWTVRVRAHDLPGDGALGRGDDTDQDYTLVVTGAS